MFFLIFKKLLFIQLFILYNYKFVNSEDKYVANYFYQNNDCKDLNFIMYSYENFEVCEVFNDTLCNGFGTYSNTQSCGISSLEDTKKKFKNNEFIYYDILDDKCKNKTSSISIIINKCISFMDSIYIKITKNNKIYETDSYLDPLCEEKNTLNNENDLDYQSLFNLSICKNKINIYNENGKLENNLEDNLNKNIKNNSNIKLTLKYQIIMSIIILILLLY